MQKLFFGIITILVEIHGLVALIASKLDAQDHQKIQSSINNVEEAARGAINGTK